jgi:hypothetical protein
MSSVAAFGYLFIGWVVGVFSLWLFAETVESLRAARARRRRRWQTSRRRMH